MRSFIDSNDRHEMQDYGETSHALKRKEKIGLKLRLGKCGKTKAFMYYGIFYFQIALKI